MIGELNYLTGQHRRPSIQNEDDDDLVASTATPPPPPPNHLSSYQRETLLTFATDDTLINNAITAAIANSNQTMKSFKRPSEILEGFRDDLKKKTALSSSSSSSAASKKSSSGFTNLVDLDQSQNQAVIKHSNLAQNVFQRTTNFTKIFDTCNNNTNNNNTTTLLAARTINSSQQKDDSYLLINQPVVSKDVCDLYAVESTVI